MAAEHSLASLLDRVLGAIPAQLSQRTGKSAQESSLMSSLGASENAGPPSPRATRLLPSVVKGWVLRSSGVPKGTRGAEGQAAVLCGQGPLTAEAGRRRLTGPGRSAPASGVWGPSSSYACVWTESLLSLGFQKEGAYRGQGTHTP